MSGSVSERQGNQRLHFPHVKSLVDLEKTVTPVFNNLYRFKRPEHAVTSGNLRHVIHELQPKVSPAGTFFNSVNQFVDVDIPKHLHYLDQLDVNLVITNNDAMADSFSSLPSNLFSRIEVRVGSDIKQTVTDLEQWFDQVVYPDPWEQIRHQAARVYSAEDYGVDTSVEIAIGADSNTIRVPINTFLTKCGIPPAICDDQITLRFYSQVASNVLGTGDVTLKTFNVHARELRGNDDTLRTVARPHLDWRFLDAKHEEKVLSLTNGSTTTWVLNNFSEDDLCSHMWVVVRNSSLAGANRDTMLSNVVSRMWLEDESGQNITNGIQWAGDDLLAQIYPDKFTNTAYLSHGLYLIFCPATDPVADSREGAVSGAQALSRNIKLRITSAATGNYTCTVLAMCHRHARISGGKATIA